MLRKFPESTHTLRRTQTLTTVGLFLAIQMVLSSYGTIQVNDSLKISLAHLALAPTAMLFGPVAAAIQGAMSDILGFLLKPTGPYFPGFTISAALGGVIYGLFLFESDRKLWQIVLAVQSSWYWSTSCSTPSFLPCSTARLRPRCFRCAR